MDFIDWCHHVLRTLEKERFHPHLSDHELQGILFGERSHEPSFHTSNARHGMFHALKALSDAGLVETDNYRLRITPIGRSVLADPTEMWTAICAHELDEEEKILLELVSRESPKQGSDPDHAWLEDVERDQILVGFSIPPPPPQTNEHMDQIQKYLYELPQLLADRGFLITDGRAGYHNDITPTYEGLVWATRRGFTVESKFIDALVDEWETTNVDFKRELSLTTKGQKGEFAKDVLALATTKSSGPRYLIVGFDNDSRAYHRPPDPAITQDRMEQVLNNLTTPVVIIRYEVVDYRLGKVGKLQVFREPEKLPYRAADDVYDEKGKKRLEKDRVYVRHGSQTEAPSPDELNALEAEGRRARGE